METTVDTALLTAAVLELHGICQIAGLFISALKTMAQDIVAAVIDHDLVIIFS